MEGKGRRIAEVVVTICTKVLWGEEVELRSLLPADWDAADYDAMCEYATAHGLQSVLIPCLSKETFEDEAIREVIVGWWCSTEEFRLQTKTLCVASEQLAAFFGERGIDVMFIKGYSLAQLYPKRLMRPFSDIDFFLYEKEKEGLAALMEAGGKCKDAWDYHVHIDYQGVALELHRSFLDRGRAKSNGVVDEVLKGLAEKEGKNFPCQWRHQDLPHAYCMSPTMNAIFLMRHMVSHFVVRKIGLRHLYDWGLFLKVYAKDVDWAYVMDVYEQVGMLEFASRVQAVLYKKMQVPLVEECRISAVHDELAEKLWCSIVDCQVIESEGKNVLLFLFTFLSNILHDRWRFTLALAKDSYWLYLGRLCSRGILSVVRKWR